MRLFSIFPRCKPAALACAILLAACSPKYDWREVRGAGAPFMIALPAKPATHARPINLDGIQVTMTMTAAEVDGVTFAVGTAELPEAAQARKALIAMKTALVRNIGGTIKQEKSSAIDAVPLTLEVEVGGPPSASTAGQPRLLLARFLAKEQRIYQLVVVGNEKAVSREAADTFFTSFKPT
jgi:hypothetical protein